MSVTMTSVLTEKGKTMWICEKGGHCVDPCEGCEHYIEVEPVVHGLWIHDINNLYGCSECMKRETMSPKKLKPYCPNCGAKMDLEE